MASSTPCQHSLIGEAETPTMDAEEGNHEHRICGQMAPPVPATPHVLVFPFPAQGHITPMLKFAELLSLAAIRVTFLNTDHYHRRLLRSPGILARLSRRPGLHLRSIPDGLPVDNPRDGGYLMEIIDALDATAPPLFREILVSGGADDDGEPVSPVTCVVADGLIGFAVDVAEEVGVPIIGFRTCGACNFWADQCTPELIATGTIPFQDGCDMDQLVAGVPGMESFLRRRDLPSFCRTKDVDAPEIQFLKRMTNNATRHRGLVLNSTEFTEASVLTHIRGLIPSTYPIGPLHALLQTVECSNNGAVEGDGTVSSSSSTSIWQEERACMEWLDGRPPSSIVYVSFGSVALLKREQLLELWQGLVNSGYHFLWVARPGLVVDGGGDGGLLGELAQATAGRGFLVGWAPQLEVLAHRAVGCFLTHSGWNSTVESMWAGVPMVCWPYFGDQHINSRLVSEVWGIGVDIKDTCDRAAVEKAVREVMAGEGGSRIRRAAAGISKTTRECVGEGGSSYMNLERLIRDIRSMSWKKPK